MTSFRTGKKDKPYKLIYKYPLLRFLTPPAINLFHEHKMGSNNLFFLSSLRAINCPKSKFVFF